MYQSNNVVENPEAFQAEMEEEFKGVAINRDVEIYMRFGFSQSEATEMVIENCEREIARLQDVIRSLGHNA